MRICIVYLLVTLASIAAAEAITFEKVKQIRKAADQGDANAQRELGNIYLCGEGVPKDYVEAVKWYRKAADQGDAMAQN